MSDINLLPIQDREREHDEEKHKALAKARSKIELTNPEEEKKKPKIKGLDLRLSAFWLKIKKTTQGAKNIFKSKSSTRVKVDMKDKLDKPETAEKPESKKEIVEHKKEFKPKKEVRQFYYAKPEHASHTPQQPVKQDEGDAHNSNKHLSDAKIKVEQPKSDYVQVKKVEPKVEPKKGVKLTAVEKRKQLVQRIHINLISSQIALTKTGYRNIKILALSGLVLVLILAGSYWGLKNVINQKQLEFEQIETSLQNINSKINNLEEEMKTANDFLAFLREVKTILNQHTYSSQLIAFMEEYTLDNVYYTSMSVNGENNTLDIEAYTEDYKTVAEQLLLFQSLTDIIDQVDISSAQIEEEIQTTTTELGFLEEEIEYIKFNILITFKPEFVQTNSSQ